MPTEHLSKSFLLKQRNELALYRRLLPSLELKRRQLMVELAREREQLRIHGSALADIDAAVQAQLPMLAETELPLCGLVQIEGVDYGEDNVVGVRLPTLEAVQLRTQAYGLLTRPAWVDALVTWLERGLRARLRVGVAQVRVERLSAALLRMSQRVNLFERVLVPRAVDNIRRGEIFLGDQARAAVVRAKLAKSHTARGQAGRR